MPKFLVRRYETIVRELIIEAEDGDKAHAIGAPLDYDEFKEADGLMTSETVVEGEADDHDVAGVPEYQPEA